MALLISFAPRAQAIDQASASRLIAPGKVCRDQPASGGRAGMTKARRAMIYMVNYARTRKGLKRYRVQKRLTWAAERKARDILRCGFSHEACGRPFDFWIKRSKYIGRGSWVTGENIAWGSGDLGNVKSIFVAWMKSAGHRKAILSRAFVDVGVGVTKGRFEGLAGARIWVLHFGDN